MKAIVYDPYGPPEVLELRELETPAPGEGEVRVRVRAVAVDYGDLLARRFAQVAPGEFHMPLLFWLIARLSFGPRRPRNPILGNQFAGDVEAVGGGVTRLRAGDAVFGYTAQRMGAYAEFVCLPKDGLLALKPGNVSYEEASAIPYGALTALSLLESVGVSAGQRVLIVGASGGIGSGALQLAKHHGAHVTAVCGTSRVAYCRALGADAVIDYTQADFTRNGETYDLILDVLGKSSFPRCKGSLAPEGRYLRASFKLPQLLQMLWTSMVGGQRVVCTLASYPPENMARVAELVAAGRVRAIVDRCYPLAQADAAHRYAESGEKTGEVVITVAP